MFSPDPLAERLFTEGSRMKEPSYFDGGYYDELGPQDKTDFEKLYRKKYRSLDEETASESFTRTFESNVEAEYRLFRDVVNAFSSGKAGFEATIVNPLYEYSEPEAEVLLAKPQANSVHLCFVSCKVGGQDYMDWTECVNSAHELVKMMTQWKD